MDSPSPHHPAALINNQQFVNAQLGMSIWLLFSSGFIYGCNLLLPAALLTIHALIHARRDKFPFTTFQKI
jgi:hypothetical protein